MEEMWHENFKLFIALQAKYEEKVQRARKEKVSKLR